MQRKLASLWIPLAAVGIAALAACGNTASSSSSASPNGGSNANLSPSQLAAQSLAALQNAGSFQIEATVSQSGTPVHFTGTIGQGGNGTMSFSTSGQTYHIVLANGSVYLDGAGIRYLLASADPSLTGTKCVQFAAGDSTISGLTDAANSQSLADSLKKLGNLTNGGTTTVNGQPGIVLNAADGSTIVVAGSGTPYPLQLKTSTGETVNFSNFSSNPPSVNPPTGCLNYQSLVGGAAASDAAAEGASPTP